jgi:hypothetical protein
MPARPPSATQGGHSGRTTPRNISNSSELNVSGILVRAFVINSVTRPDSAAEALAIAHENGSKTLRIRLFEPFLETCRAKAWMSAWSKALIVYLHTVIKRLRVRNYLS